MDRSDWVSAATTDIGTVRKVNEDDCLEAPEVGMWCVADGMGGHEKGDVASRMIVDYLNCLNSPEFYPLTTLQITERLRSVNTRLVEMGRMLPESSVIGSTVVVLLFDDEQAHCIWAGDSRIYRLRDGSFKQLTRDHSQVEEMVEAGLITAEEAEVHPSANVITRAVGANAHLELDVVSADLKPGDQFLLCSDGLNKVLTDNEIAEMIRVCALNSTTDNLIERALERQARDNVTAILVQFKGGISDHQSNTDPLHSTQPLDDTLPLRR